MKKFFKIFGVVIIVFIAVLLIVPFAFRGKIDGIIKKEANDMLNAKFDYSKLGISFFKNFPNASLNLKQLKIEGVGEFEGDTLVFADEISVVVNPFSIFKESGIKVNKIILNNPHIFGYVLENGKANWDIMKEDSTKVEVEDVEESSFKLHINTFKISNASVRYLDEQGKMEFNTYPFNAQLKGDLSGDVTTLDINALAEKVFYKMDNQIFANGQALGINGLIEANLANNKYTFTNTQLLLNAVNMGVNGDVLLADEYMDFNLKADCKHVNFKDILSLIPAVYTNDFKSLNVGGDLSMDAWVNGRMQGENVPAFGIKMNVNNGSFKYNQLPKSVTDIYVNLAMENGGGTMDATKIDLSKLSMVMAGNKLDASLKLSTPISDPNFDAVAKGVVDFGQIKEVYPLPDSVNLSGRITADFAVKGRMTQIEKEEYEQISAKGTFNVKDFEAVVGDMPKVLVDNAYATITPKKLVVSDVVAFVGRSDFKISGGLENYIGYVLKSTELKGNLNVESKLLDLNEILGLDSSAEEATDGEIIEEQESSDTTQLIIPKNLNLDLKTSLKEVYMNKIEIKDLVGKIVVKDGVANLDGLSMNAFDGKLDVSGLYSSNDVTAPVAKFNLNFKDASFKTTFNQLDMIKKIVPIFEKTGGNYSMKMDLSTTLTSNLSPVWKSFNAQGDLTTSNINIQNVKALSDLSTALKDEKLKNWEIKDAVIIKFTVKDGKVSTKPFNLKVGNVGMNIGGITGLDNTIDYSAKVTLPDNKFMKTANVKIGGTFASPKISLDAKETVNELLKGVVGDKLQGGVDSLLLKDGAKKDKKEILEKAGKAIEGIFKKTKK
jgi:hypothetical protein